VRTPDKTSVNIVRMGETASAARMTLQPGWRWSECIKPVVGTDGCQVRHSDSSNPEGCTSLPSRQYGSRWAHALTRAERDQPDHE